LQGELSVNKFERGNGQFWQGKKMGLWGLQKNSDLKKIRKMQNEEMQKNMVEVLQTWTAVWFFLVNFVSTNFVS